MSTTASQTDAPRANAAAAAVSPPASPHPADHSRAPAGKRIYYLHPLAAGAPREWDARFARAAALGFTDILLAPPFMPGRTGDIFQTLDHRRLHPALGGGDANAALAVAAAQAAGHGLGLLLDLVVDRVAAESPLATPSDDPPDPRLPGWRQGAAQPSLEANALGLWHRLVAEWLEAGVRGFRCEATDRVPAMVWRQLIVTARAHSADALFIAAEPVPALAGCGFDLAACKSWAWDGRADWLAEDIAAAAVVAPVLAMAEAPFGRRAGSDLAARRGLAIASAIGAAWMMPMGVETGARRPLDPRRAGPAGGTSSLAEAVAQANRRHAALAALPTARLRSAPGAAVALFARGPLVTVAVNTRLDRTAALADDAGMLAPAEVKVIETPQRAPVIGVAPSVEVAVKAPRIAIEAIAPMVDGGRFPAKRRLGDWVDVEVDLISDGHEMLAGMLLWRPADEAVWHETPLRLLNNDRWTARFPAARMGRHVFTVEAWRDEFGTFQADLAKKQAAGRDLTQEIAEGVALLAKLLPDRVPEQAPGDQALAILLDPATAAAVDGVRHRPFLVHFEPAVPVDIEREAASFGSWYELFPRSQSGDERRHGTFDDVIARLPAIRDMGFDVLYFPPIHPIGRTNRKGRNNALTAAPDDPGSPYAIGGAEGGHDAIHPDLGTLEDFLRLRDEAARQGLELALDFAIQCSPDHPWLRTHRDWFAWRPDGSIKYAENPPKRYEDIVNVDFYAPGALPSLWIGLRNVVAFWIEQGVRIFRVDNPHTKPLPFWEWMIGDIRATHPDVIFLAEAFTRPKMMYRLAKVGFAQSYTYFTWRDSAFEMREYLTELTTTAPRDFFRPHFFVNTPDINPVFLQRAGRAGFLIRAALAATLSGLWGVYSGFELCEAAALPGREEYADSEKYQIRAWDWQRPGNIVDTVTRLNAIRRANPALQTHLGVTFLPSTDPDVLVFAKSVPGNTVVVAVSFDPNGPRETDIVLPPALWQAVGGDVALTGTDLMAGHDFPWHSGTSRIGLDPAAPFLIWRLRRSDGD
jgi:starch synthase (maltosyl-transferring)